MLCIYLLVLLLFPLAALWGAKPAVHEPGVLLTRDDTAFTRGVATCLVILSHLCARLSAETEGMNHIFYTAVFQLGGVGNLLFFFVSGYGIHKSNLTTPPCRDYLWKRVKAVYFPYLTIESVFYIVSCLTRKTAAVTLTDILSILFIREWFIGAIIIQYIAYYIFRKYCAVKRLPLYSCVFDGVASIAFLACGLPDKWANSLWLFTVGLVFVQYEKQILAFIRKGLWLKMILSLILFAVLGGVFAMFKGTLWANIFKPVSGVFLCLALCCLLQKFSFPSRLMAYLGRRSLYIYVVHDKNLWPLLSGIAPFPRFWLTLALTPILSEALAQLVNLILLKVESAAKKAD